jgi:enamine deaminase RidA (YjgF/YER057c/UK114 family)
MAKKISLKRFGTMPLVPVPRAVRAGDYIFTSSVYPVDESGRVVGLDTAQDEVRPSLMEIQARHCLESLKLTHELPDVLLAVEFGCARRQRHE